MSLEKEKKKKNTCKTNAKTENDESETERFIDEQHV